MQIFHNKLRRAREEGGGGRRERESKNLAMVRLLPFIAFAVDFGRQQNRKSARDKGKKERQVERKGEREGEKGIENRGKQLAGKTRAKSVKELC